MPDFSASALVFWAIRGRVWIARIGGGIFLLFAVGLGLGIVLESELIVAEEATRFQVTETSRGLAPQRPLLNAGLEP